MIKYIIENKRKIALYYAAFFIPTVSIFLYIGVEIVHIGWFASYFISNALAATIMLPINMYVFWRK